VTAVVWASVLLAIPFLIAFSGVPLWMTFKRPQAGPDHSQAHAYLRSKAAFAEAGAVTRTPVTSGAGSPRQPADRIRADRSSATAAGRDHARGPPATSTPPPERWPPLAVRGARSSPHELAVAHRHRDWRTRSALSGWPSQPTATVQLPRTSSTLKATTEARS
jgi:hypothetical protein